MQRFAKADLEILILRAAGLRNPAERERTEIRLNEGLNGRTAERKPNERNRIEKGTGGSRVLPPVLRDRKESSAVMRKQIEKMNTLFLCISSC
jgi:hypothetical protein